jgi:hypothetical protein
MSNAESDNSSVPTRLRGIFLPGSESPTCLSNDMNDTLICLVGLLFLETGNIDIVQVRHFLSLLHLLQQLRLCLADLERLRTRARLAV